MLSKNKFISRLKTPFLLSSKIQCVLLFSILITRVAIAFFDASFVAEDDSYGFSYAFWHVSILQIIVAYAYTHRLRFLNQIRTLGFLVLYSLLLNLMFSDDLYLVDNIYFLLFVLGANYLLGRKLKFKNP